MKLIINQISPAEVPSAVRVLLTLRKQPFFFGLSNGTVYMNRDSVEFRGEGRA